MITRSPPPWPMGGMPPIVKPVSSFASTAVARRTSGSPDDRGEASEVDAVGAGHEAQDRLRGPARPGATKTSDFTICPSSAPTAAAASSAVCVHSGKTWMSRVTPLRAAASTTRWTAGGGGSRARPRVYTTRPARRRPGEYDPARCSGPQCRPLHACATSSSSRTATCPRAPRSTPRGPAGLTASPDVVAADGGLRAGAWPLASCPTCWSATSTRSHPALAGRGREAAGIGGPARPAPTRTSRTRSWPSSRRSRRGATRVTVLGAFGGPRLDHALANLWLLAPPGASPAWS